MFTYWNNLTWSIAFTMKNLKERDCFLTVFVMSDWHGGAGGGPCLMTISLLHSLLKAWQNNKQIEIQNYSILFGLYIYIWIVFLNSKGPLKTIAAITLIACRFYMNVSILIVVFTIHLLSGSRCRLAYGSMLRKSKACEMWMSDFVNYCWFTEVFHPSLTSWCYFKFLPFLVLYQWPHGVLSNHFAQVSLSRSCLL